MTPNGDSRSYFIDKGTKCSGHVLFFVILQLQFITLPHIMPTSNFGDFVARIKELDHEIDHLSEMLKKGASINGAALSNPSLLLINFVEPEHLKTLWRLPYDSFDVEKALPDLEKYITDYLGTQNDISIEGIPAWNLSTFSKLSRFLCTFWSY